MQGQAWSFGGKPQNPGLTPVNANWASPASGGKEFRGLGGRDKCLSSLFTEPRDLRA